MYEQIIASITIKDALKILENYYKKEYERYEDVLVEFPIKHYNRYFDSDGDRVNESGYLLQAEIKYSKKMKDLVLCGKITKSSEDIENDLYKEIKEIYKDEEYEIIHILFSTKFKKSSFDLDTIVNIQFIKKAKKVKQIEFK